MPDSSKAVFISYTSQDAAAAARICESLRAAGIDVWFDQSELRGGESWDRRITTQIYDCALFLALISAHTEARSEGYFRREWRIAVDRTRDMADDQPFLLPVALDATSEASARVPDKFREVQWIRLPSAQDSQALIGHVTNLLTRHDPAPSKAASYSSSRQAASASRPGSAKRRISILTFAAALILIGAYFGWQRLVESKRVATAPASTSKSLEQAPAASIAVLPFVDMSEKKDQEFFSDGLTEELIDHLTQNADLKVIARTSSFEFKGKNADVRTIAGRLNVANVLEGSVRRVGQELRVTVQLIRATDGVHLWSKTYDRKLDDIFKIQDDIASRVSTAMNSVLSPTAQPDVGTANADAYTLYLRAIALSRSANSQPEYDRAIDCIQEAIKADPGYSDAWSLLAETRSNEADEGFGDAAKLKIQAKEAADRALELGPNNADAHIAQARILLHEWQFAMAETQVRQAFALDPRNPLVLVWMANIAETMGRLKEAEELRLRAIKSDPMNASRYWGLAGTLYSAERFDEAYTMMRRSMELAPASSGTHVAPRGAHNFAGLLLLLKGDPKAALAEMDQETDQEYRDNCYCRVLVYDALGRSAEADKLLAVFEKTHDMDDGRGIAAVYAERSRVDLAFHWLELAYQHREFSLVGILVDPLFNGLAADPRFNALLSKMKLPARDAIK